MSKKVLALSLLVSFASVGLVACEKSETEGKPNVTATEPVETTKPAETTAETTGGAKAPESQADEKTAGELPALEGIAVNQEKSKIEWVGAKISGDHKGTFEKFNGAIKLDDAGKVTSIAFAADTTSVTSDNDKLTEHLKSPDFFDVEKHPVAAFNSTEIKEGSEVKPGEGQAAFTHTVTGNMDLHGQKKSITFPARIDASGDVVTASTEFNLNRFDFGIEYKGKPDDLIKKEVLLKINFEAPKAAAK